MSIPPGTEVSKHAVLSKAISKVVLVDCYPVKGSGFVIGDGNLILTCHHCVKDSEVVDIMLSSGEIVRGDVTAHDEKNDLAIIKLPNRITIQPVEFEDMEKVRVGDPVVAIGHPFGLGISVTEGVISNLDQVVWNNHFVQTDAIIHDGNSGGTLVRLATGNVIAVNSNSIAPGISFGIPSTAAMEFIENANKTCNQYTIGVSMLTYAPKVVILTDVWPSYPTHEAGLSLCIGEMVVDINGQSISSALDVFKAVRMSGGYPLIIRTRTCPHINSKYTKYTKTRVIPR